MHFTHSGYKGSESTDNRYESGDDYGFASIFFVELIGLLGDGLRVQIGARHVGPEGVGHLVRLLAADGGLDAFFFCHEITAPFLWRSRAPASSSGPPPAEAGRSGSAFFDDDLVPGGVGQKLEPVLGDEHCVAVAHRAQLCAHQAGLHREDHAGSQGGLVALGDGGELVGGQAHPVAAAAGEDAAEAGVLVLLHGGEVQVLEDGAGAEHAEDVVSGPEHGVIGPGALLIHMAHDDGALVLHVVARDPRPAHGHGQVAGHGDVAGGAVTAVVEPLVGHAPDHEGVDVGGKVLPIDMPLARIARMREASRGKDTTIGHWEISGVISPKPLPTYPNGFPEEVLKPFREQTGRGVLCNKPYSGTEVIKAYGDEHVRTGDLIVYTSADSVFQIAAHEDVVPPEQLYEYCRIARKILQGEHGVGRVIARPFIGTSGQYTRTPRRHDFSLEPPKQTMLDAITEAGQDVIAVGKIHDIFAGRGMTEFTYTSGNAEGIEKTLSYLQKDFNGLCFINLVDYDMLYGHRNDIDGYAKALAYFDEKLPEIMAAMRDEDMLIITADHGCDPGYTVSTDHSREHTPCIMYGKHVRPENLGTRETFADIGATVLDYLGVTGNIAGKSML